MPEDLQQGAILDPAIVSSTLSLSPRVDIWSPMGPATTATLAHLRSGGTDPDLLRSRPRSSVHRLVPLIYASPCLSQNNPFRVYVGYDSHEDITWEVRLTFRCLRATQCTLSHRRSEEGDVSATVRCSTRVSKGDGEPARPGPADCSALSLFLPTGVQVLDGPPLLRAARGHPAQAQGVPGASAVRAESLRCLSIQLRLPAASPPLHSTPGDDSAGAATAARVPAAGSGPASARSLPSHLAARA